MDEQHRRPLLQLRRQVLRPREQPRIADDAGNGVRPARADMQRHHRALAEADQREAVVGEAEAASSASRKASSAGAADDTPCAQQMRVGAGKREPLAADRRLAAGLGRMRRDEGGVGQDRRPACGRYR